MPAVAGVFCLTAARGGTRSAETLGTLRDLAPQGFWTLEPTGH